jgi:hypothetical protein
VNIKKLVNNKMRKFKASKNEESIGSQSGKANV